MFEDNGGSGSHYKGSYSSEELNCKSVDFLVALSFPKPTILKTLKIGDTLNIEVENDIVVVKRKDKIVGNVIHKLVEKLLICISKGFKYKAIITKIDEGLCEVNIKNK